MTRYLTLSVDLSDDGAIAQVTAECVDEATTVTIVNVPVWSPTPRRSAVSSGGCWSRNTSACQRRDAS